MRKYSLLLISATILSLFLVACGGTDGGSDAGGEIVDLSQTLTYEDEMGATVTINYPEGWSASAENGSASFASSEELLAQAASSDLPDVASGEVVAVSLALPAEMASFFMEEGADPSPTALANAFVSELVNEGDTIGEVEEVTLGDHTGAVVQGTSDGTDLVLVTIDLGEGSYALVFGATAEGEGDSIRATIEGIAGSIDYAVAGGE